MVFSSVPFYLDPPNWHHQQPNHHHHQGTVSENPQLPLVPSSAHVVGGSIRPGSMAERARLAKPDQAPMKCPRCESTDTKFCYFNNYSLSQPRHFCKTCRRYWTRGGGLRNVPVGGGFRRNKKSKSNNSSKSSANNNTETQMGNSNSTEIIGHLPQQTPQIPLMPSLNNLSQYNMGLNFGAMQQFPLFEHAPNTGLYSFQSEGIELQAPSSLVGDDNQLCCMASSARVSELAPVKMEDHQGLNNQY